MTHTILVEGTAQGAIGYQVAFGDGAELAFNADDAHAQVPHQYTVSGSYQVSVAVSRQGVFAAANGPVFVLDPPPLAMSISASRPGGYVPFEVLFRVRRTDGTASGPVSYRIDFDGDGAFDAAVTTEAPEHVFSHEYSALGAVTVLSCITQESAEACASATITAEAVPPVGQRAFHDRPDDDAGLQMHAVYVSCTDCPDNGLDVDGTLANSVGSFQNWFALRTGLVLREDLYGGERDIGYFRMPMTMAEIAAWGALVVSVIYDSLHAAGFSDPDKKYLIYYSGYSNHACGGALIDGPASAMYLGGWQGRSVCGGTLFATSPLSAPEYWEFAALHDFVHTLGYVDFHAPNHDPRSPAHTTDSCRDLMGGGNGPNGNSIGWCPDEVDVRNDDYFGDALGESVRNLKVDPWLKSVAASEMAIIRARAERRLRLFEPFVHDLIHTPSAK